MKRSFREFLYVAGGAPVGALWFTLLGVGIATGVSTGIVIVGIPLLALTLLFWRWAANVERGRAALVLGAPIGRPPEPVPARPTFLSRWRARITDRATWKELGYLLALGPVGVLSGTVAITVWALALAAVISPAVTAAAPGQSLLGRASIAALIAVVIGGLAVGALAVLLTRLMSRGVIAIARGLLAPDERALLAARVSALEASRAGAVESADARLRRLERDLHDGAQHRLAYIAMELDRARSKIHSDPDTAQALLSSAHEESKRAMAELRDLVRGIHPSVLTDRGLDAAVSGLAERCPVPVQITIRVPERPPAAVETAAYYLIAEALTNIAKHSGAHTCAVEVLRDDDRLEVEIRDDGRGGAERKPGSGLEGLAQRVEALDGAFTVDSPPGGPTLIRAELPCGS